MKPEVWIGRRRRRRGGGGEKVLYIRYPSGKFYVELLHRLIAAAYYGVELTRQHDVHHIDHDPLNNHPHNLAVMSRSDHLTWHTIERRWMRPGVNIAHYADVATAIIQRTPGQHAQLALLRSLPVPLRFVMQSDLWANGKTCNAADDWICRTCLYTAHQAHDLAPGGSDTSLSRKR